MESTPTPAEMAAGRAGRTILSVSLGFKDRPKSGSPGQMYGCAEPALSNAVITGKLAHSTLPERHFPPCLDNSRLGDLVPS